MTSIHLPGGGRAMRSKANAENDPQMGKRVHPATARAALGDLVNRANIPIDAKKIRGALKANQPQTQPLNLVKKKPSIENAAMDVVEGLSAVPSTDDQAMDFDDDPLSATSPAAVIPDGVDNIDSEDASNPQMAPQYVNEIYAYMRQLERQMPISKAYMTGKKTALKPRMRNLMVDWLVDVHSQFALLQETLYMSVGLMDRYFEKNLGKLSTKEVQLVGVACLFVAAKYEEMYPPELGDFVYITDKAYTEQQILQMEIDVISTLEFSLSRPLPLNFLRRASKAGMVDAETHTVAKYALEVALVDYEMAHVHPSVAAAAALALALSVYHGTATLLRKELWTPNLQFYTTYSISDLEECLQAMAKRILVINAENSVEDVKEQAASKNKKRINRAVFKKFSGKKFSKIAVHPALGDVAMQELAAGQF